MTKIKLLTGGFIILLLLIILIANLGLGPVYFPFIYSIPGLDKIGHFFLIGLLSYLVNTILLGQKIKVLSLRLLKGSLIIFLIVVLEEVSQLFLTYRAFSLMDLVADFAGIIIFGRLSLYKQRSKHNSSNTIEHK